MTKKFTIAWGSRWPLGIRYGHRWVLHLMEGTELNHQNIRWIVGRLNGKNAEPPGKKPAKPAPVIHADPEPEEYPILKS